MSDKSTANHLLQRCLENDGQLLTTKTRLINPDILRRTRYIPVCKETVAYIVSVLLFNEHGHVCLIQEAKKECHGRWYLPAGRAERNESLVEAARREALEETGYEVEPLSLVCVEIDHIGLWYRFTFAARIVGGSLKTTEKADSESLQAQWYSIESVKDKYFKRRSFDMIRSIEIAYEYYQYYNVHSLMGFEREKLLEKQINLPMPSAVSAKHMTFSFLIVSHKLTHCLLFAAGDELLLPAVPIVPDVYLKQVRKNFFLKLF
jgi:ADP-ribose pyrophosphatase YjhB (NUDIX family)